MQADVILALSPGVERIKPPGGIMPLQDQHLLAEHPETHRRREAGHAGADNDRIVMGARDAHGLTVQVRG